MASKKSTKKAAPKRAAKKAPVKKASSKKTAKKKAVKKPAAKALKRFLVTYYMSAAAQKKAAAMRKANPKAMQEGMAKWMAWGEKMGAHLVDFGAPLGEGVKFDAKGNAPSKRQLNGYSFIQAKSLAEAKRLMKGHPHLSWTPTGCELEVHEALPMG